LCSALLHFDGGKTMATSIDQQIEARHARRMAADDRHLTRLERRETMAAHMIGELASGKLYVYPVGGRYREGTRGELIEFLIRNRYV
jgi:hypothetical protein